MPNRTPHEIIHEIINNWPSVRVPISAESIQTFLQQYAGYLTADFDTTTFALLLNGEGAQYSSLYIHGDVGKMLVTIDQQLWLAVFLRNAASLVPISDRAQLPQVQQQVEELRGLAETDESTPTSAPVGDALSGAPAPEAAPDLPSLEALAPTETPIDTQRESSEVDPRQSAEMRMQFDEAPEEFWLLHVFTYRCARCFGQGYLYTGGEICPECGGIGWGAAGDVEFHPGKGAPQPY